MMEEAYVDHNNKDSLESRISLCQMIMEASEQIEELNQLKENIEPPSSVYGTVDELLEAHTVFDNAKIMMHVVIDQEEIREALAQGLITEEEAWKISKERERAIVKEEARVKKNKLKRKL